MAITLQEAKVGMADKVDQQIIDTFRRSSLLLDALTFDNAISPGTGGSTLTYGYIQLKSPSTAAIRTINTEYTPNEAKREEKTARAEIMGGSFEVDRVLQNTSGAVDELAFQAEQKIKATANEFHNRAINSESGLKATLAGTENEFTSEVDLSTSDLMDENYSAFLDELDTLIASVDGTPSMLLVNGDMLTKIRSTARRAGYYTRSEDAFGQPVENYNNIPIVNVGNYYDGSKSVGIIPTGVDGTTEIYAVSIGLDGFHGISPVGNNVIQGYMPDMTAPGAVKKGEVELVAGVVLKNTLKAAVLKGIKVKPTA
jgi:hypothetical protein